MADDSLDQLCRAMGSQWRSVSRLDYSAGDPGLVTAGAEFSTGI